MDLQLDSVINLGVSAMTNLQTYLVTFQACVHILFKQNACGSLGFSDTGHPSHSRTRATRSQPVSPYMKTILLNGMSIGHGQARAVFPGRVSESRADSFSPSGQWVCREIGPGCQTQPGSHAGHGRSQAVLGKPPLHDGVRRASSARSPAARDRGRQREQSWGGDTPPPGAPATGAEGEPLSPSLDETIENLNNLILELDPTFQPIGTCPKPSYLSRGSQRPQDASGDDRLLDAYGPGILLYDEWDSRGAGHGGASLGRKPEAGWPELELRSAAPFYRTPESAGCSGLQVGQAYGPSSSSAPLFRAVSPDSWIVESSTAVAVPISQPTQGAPWLALDSSSSQQIYQPVAAPYSSSYSGSVGGSPPHRHGNLALTREAPVSYLSTSAGSDNQLNSHQGHRCRLGDSASSLLSTSSGGWDTLGSSHSLLSDDGEPGTMYRSAGSTYGSSGSFVNLTSPHGVQQPYRASDCQTLPLPRMPAQAPRLPGPAPGQPPRRGVKKESSSCPASAASSCTDIPLLLVNGSALGPEPERERRRQASGSFSTASLPRSASPNRASAKSSSATSLTDLPCSAEPTVKFVQGTSKYWYKPHISREQAIEMLKDEEVGSFVIRESSTYVGSFGLALKVSPGPESPERKTGDSPAVSVRHFLIEFSRKGVCLKGGAQEPYFGSLSAFVYQHCITPISLPHKLRLPRTDSLRDTAEGAGSGAAGGNVSPPRNQQADHCVLYLKSVAMESLSGPQAVLKAASYVLEQGPLPEATTVHFKVTEQGITLTDSKRKLFFRRHYQASSIKHCGLDPLQRRWRKDNKPSRIFAFVAQEQGGRSENVCHVFAESESENTAQPIIGPGERDPPEAPRSALTAQLPRSLTAAP
ncbi:tensin-4-like [Hypanus sabinus]|uniref:tensin-4-like n=1 Tax=Hypanus sabinus TaxID=79690 RepID=UPI0028C4B2B1|nr:tensin-4-like [Hypanus sabinus]